MSLWSSIKSIFSGGDSSSSSSSTTSSAVGGQSRVSAQGGGMSVQVNPSTGNVVTPTPSGGGSSGGKHSSGGRSSSGGGSSGGFTPIPQEDLQQQSIATPQDLEAPKPQPTNKASNKDLSKLQKFEASKVSNSQQASKIFNKSMKNNQTSNKLYKNLYKGSYSKKLNSFVKPSPTGFGSTAYLQQPTPSEQAKIKRAEKLGAFEPLPKDITPMGVSEKVGRGIVNVGLGAYDFITAGSQSAKRLENKQIRLNEDIEKFNEKYGGKELDDKEYTKALSEGAKLEGRQEKINQEKKDTINSPFYKASAFTFGTFGRGELNPMIDPNTGKPIKVHEGMVPLIPEASALNKIRDVKFIGTQKAGRTGNIRIDLIFKTKGRLGVATGISRKGEDELIETVVGGRSGSVGLEFPTRKLKPKKIQSFLGRGLSKQKQIGAKVKTEFQTDKALLNIVDENEIALTKNIGLAESVSAKGNKIVKTGIKFPSGKIVKKPADLKKDLSFVESLAEPKEDLTKIYGATRSIKGGGTRFKGVIKKIDSITGNAGKRIKGFGRKPTSYTKVQEKALQDTMGAVSSSLSKPRPIITSQITRAVTGAEPLITKAKQLTKTKQPRKVKTKEIQVSKLDKESQEIFSLTTNLDKSMGRVRTRTSNKAKIKGKANPKLNVNEATLQRQQTKQTQALKQPAKQELNQIQSLTSITPISAFSEPFGKPVIYFRKRKKKMAGLTKKPAPSYDVYIKPPKKKKYVKITKKPISLQDARDLRNYGIDRSTSRQGYLKPRKSKPSKPQYIIPKGYSQATRNKFRTFKQKKGKRTKLRKDRVIELSKNALDTPSELKQLNIFKVMAQREKKKKKKMKNTPVGLNFA